MMTPVTITKFLAGWLPAFAVTASIDPAPRLADVFTFAVGGYQVPPVTCLLGAIGVLAARPLARRSESGLSWPMFALVSLIMLLTVELWVLEARPGALFAFVVAIGLGFSGYSVIELAGNEIRAVIVNFIRSAPFAGRTVSSAPQPGDNIDDKDPGNDR